MRRRWEDGNVTPLRNGNAGPRLLVAPDDLKSPAAEAFRALRTNLQFLGLDRALGTVIVTSPGPGEGKSTVTANLGVALGLAGSQVILVGADLRKPTLHRHFGLSNDVGLTSVLTGNVRWQDALQDTGFQGVRVLAAGPIPPNPAELLGTERMRELIGELRDAADMVIFDTPPVLNVTDAGVLAQRVDGVIYVISAGVTPRDIARAGKQRLEQVGARLLGTVVNRVEPRGGNYYYYYYGYYGADDAADPSVPWWRRLLAGRGNGEPRGRR